MGPGQAVVGPARDLGGDVHQRGDTTIVDVAIPDISHDLDAGVSELQWVMDGFLIALHQLARQSGGAMGIAIIGSVFAAV